MTFFQTNISYGAPKKLSAWRKIAIGTWRNAGDPSVYGLLEFEVEMVLAYIEKLKSQSGARITITHFVGKAMAETVRRHPSINCVLRFGRLYPRQSVDLFFQVATDVKGEDLSGVTVRQISEKSIVQIAQEIETRAKAVREKKDQTFTKVKNLTGAMPGFLAPFLVNLGGFISYFLNLRSPALGLPHDPFGSAMITNVGSLGLDMAFVPLVPYSRVPLLIAIGAIRDRPVVHGNQVVVAKTIQLCATFDHRVIDGVHAGQIANTLRKIFADPEVELGGV